VSTQVGCRKNAHASLHLGKMADIDIGNQVLGVVIFSQNISFENFGIGFAVLHEKTAFRKEETAFTYPSQQICWFGNWPASHYFYHLIKMLNCFWTSSGKVVNIFHLFYIFALVLCLSFMI